MINVLIGYCIGSLVTTILFLWYAIKIVDNHDKKC